MNSKSIPVFLQPVSQEKVFWCYDGKIISSLEELNIALKEMTEETFRYHANAEKNDFSKWVRDVIGDIILADQMETILSQDAATRKVAARIKSFKSKRK